MSIFHDQCLHMLNNDQTVGKFNEAQTDAYGNEVEQQFDKLATSKNVSEAVTASTQLLRVTICLLASMGLTPDQMLAHWQARNVLTARDEEKGTTIAEALLLNQGVVNTELLPHD